MNKVNLNKDQINQLFSFVKSKYVRYIDVQHEIVDHLASAIEEEIEAGYARNFDEALKLVYSRFPITGFAQFVEGKEKSLVKYWRKKIWTHMFAYLTLPKLVLTIFLVLATFYIFSNSPSFIVLTILFLALGYNLFLTFKTHINIKEIYNGECLLLNTFKQAAGIGNMSFGLYIYLNNVLNILDSHILYPWQIAIISFLFVAINIWNYSLYSTFPIFIKQEINTKYPYLKIA